MPKRHCSFKPRSLYVSIVEDSPRDICQISPEPSEVSQCARHAPRFGGAVRKLALSDLASCLRVGALSHCAAWQQEPRTGTAKGNADDHDHGSSNSVMQQQPIRTRTRTLKGVAINTGTESAQSSISSQCVDMLRDGCGVPKQRQL